MSTSIESPLIGSGSQEEVDLRVAALIGLGKSRGYLTYEELNEKLPDEVVSPDKLDTLLMRIDEMGIKLIDELDIADYQQKATAKKSRGAAAAAAPAQEKEEPAVEELTEEEEEELDLNLEAELAEASSKRIDDPVRMYLTQMGEIPLLTREQEIFLAKTIEITRKRFRKKAMGSGLALRAALKTLEEVERGELAFDRTLKVNPNPKPDDDPKIVETLGKNFLAKRLPVNLVTIRRLIGQIKEEYRPLLDQSLTRQERSERLEAVQT